MSNPCEIPRIDKCILSRLWYTSFVILQKHGNINSLLKKNKENLIDIEQLIQHTEFTDHDHKWMYQTLMYKLTNNESSKQQIQQKLDNIEFITVLDQIDCPELVREELLELFLNINKDTISQETLNFLQTIIYEDPSLSCWMINKLLSIQSKGNSTLLNVCFVVLMESLEQFVSQTSQSNIKTILCLLSTINFSELKNEFSKHINSYPEQKYALKSNEIRDMKTALYYGQNTEVFCDWYKILCRLHGKTKFGIDIENSELIRNSIFNIDEEGRTSLDHKELLSRTVTRKIHWLNDVMTICDTDNDFSSILSCPCLHYLAPILLFGSLSECSEERKDENTSIYNYFNLLLENSNFDNSDDPTLRSVYSTLKNHLSIAKWILYREDEGERKIRIKQVLQLLQSSNVLRVLKLTTNIHNINDEEMNNLLKQNSMPDNVFQAYKSLSNALKAILLCNCYTKNHSSITEYLVDMKLRLINLQPLNLKLETIENIFSLLFLRYEDFFPGTDDERVEKEPDEEERELSPSKEKSKYRKKKKKPGSSIFICNKYAVREILYHLAEIVESIESDSEEESKNITTIKKSLTDANWRLELLMDSNFLKRIDLSTNDDSLCEEINLKDDSRSNKVQMKNIDDTEIDSESDFVTDSSLNSNNKKLDISSGRGSSFLNRMLANPDSLILQCLWEKDYARAENVIKVYKLKDTYLDGQVRFSKALRSLKENMKKYETNKESENLVKDHSMQSTLENIRLTAQEGIHTSRYTGQLETFLTSQETCFRILNTDFIRSNEILALAVLDLALTTRQTYHSCEVALKYLKSCSSLNETEHETFFIEIIQLLRGYDKSIFDILLNVKIPLQLKHDFWIDLDDTLSKLKSSNNFIIEFDKLIRIFDNLGNEKNYLQSTYNHLSILHDIGNHFKYDLLENSLHSYFGYQLFQLEKEPNELESIANQLGVDLVYSILVNTCSKIDFNDVELNSSMENKNQEIVLNTNSTELLHSSNQNPNQCISEILSEILQVLEELCPERSVIDPTIGNHSRIRDTLNKTISLKTLDLSELSVGDETLVFFLNTWNVMFLHSMLTIWTTFNDLKHEVSLTTIGYTIGDLGFVTLNALRSKLLPREMSNLKYFIDEMEELNEPAWQDLDLVQDPRVIFAMANEFLGSPLIRVYHEKTLKQDLQRCMIDYLNFYSSNVFNDEPSKLYLPEIVRRYDEFCVNNPQDSLFLVKDYFERFNIEYLGIDYTYEIVLKYEERRGQPSKQHEKTNNSSSNLWPINETKLQYLENRCWILSYLVEKIHKGRMTIDSKRTSCFLNLLQSPWIDQLKIFFNNNETLTAIRGLMSVEDFWIRLESESRNEEWINCLEIIDSIDDEFLMTNLEIRCCKDKILSHLVTTREGLTNDTISSYIYQIENIHVIVQTVLHNIKKWPLNVCEDSLLHALHHKDTKELPVHCKIQMEEYLCRIRIFQKMLPYCVDYVNGVSWYDVVYCTEKTDPSYTVKCLIDADEFELCLELLECQNFSLKLEFSLTLNLLIGLLKNDRKGASKLLRVLPLNRSVKLCKVLLKRIDSIEALIFLVNYLIEHCKATETAKYRNTLTGIEILKNLDKKDRMNYIHLIKEPLLMMEQLLMNCKFESLTNTLKNDLSTEFRTNFDEIVRFYANKSLDFRVSLNRGDNVEYKIKNTEEDVDEFVMPSIVPRKEQWVPNEKARKCSCCKAVIFSMFNRRHHCRRCGRVVCAICSQHRLQVTGYPDSVPVRVCVDCKNQTKLLETQVTPASSQLFDYWRLSKDEQQNQTVREEFSFEYAPNISLCLAILNYHSNNKLYTSFLFDRCDEMKRLLQPINPEIDHAVIIRMIKSLLVAAKVKCAKLGFNTGLTHCDNFLSQVDFIATLAQSDCKVLIPSEDLDTHTLRRLRDSLTEKEEWTLALDVSTKSGLDTQGVWAAWGKACLKFARFEQARDKFVHCLDKILYEESDDWVILSYPKTETTSQSKNVTKNRPLKNPPLLSEILQILNDSYTHKQSNDILYKEIMYYLFMYGSNNSILEFFIKHREWDKCLVYVLDNQLDPEFFYDGVYLRCLKNGSIDKLHENMKLQDESLLIWKKYLVHTCHNLEKKTYMNILYQLQLFMRDYVRASMTCIRFYINEPNSYVDLSLRGHFLLDAQKHLESELKLKDFGKSRKKSVTSVEEESLTMEIEPSEIDKHINTISRQMEIAKFLANGEKEGRIPCEFLNLLPDFDTDNRKGQQLPTLFGNQQQKTHLAVLAILCGRDVEEGFGIAFRIMQDYNLRTCKVYSLAGHVLALKRNTTAIDQLIKCCNSSGAPNSLTTSDFVLTHCIKLLLARPYSESESNIKDEIDGLIRLIVDVELKINAYIESKQLKAAYLLAVKHSRVQDIKKILKESDRCGQQAIKTICMKWLQQTKHL